MSDTNILITIDSFENTPGELCSRFRVPVNITDLGVWLLLVWLCWAMLLSS